jgi:ATP-dependent DNA helicase RecG
MGVDRQTEYLTGLLRELCKLPQETEWVEFKVNEAEPKEIGEYISALSNGATLTAKAFGYLVWGIRDGDHAVVGTAFGHGRRRLATKSLRTGCSVCSNQRSSSASTSWMSMDCTSS